MLVKITSEQSQSFNIEDDNETKYAQHQHPAGRFTTSVIEDDPRCREGLNRDLDSSNLASFINLRVIARYARQSELLSCRVARILWNRSTREDPHRAKGKYAKFHRVHAREFPRMHLQFKIFYTGGGIARGKMRIRVYVSLPTIVSWSNILFFSVDAALDTTYLLSILCIDRCNWYSEIWMYRQTKIRW